MKYCNYLIILFFIVITSVLNAQSRIDEQLNEYETASLDKKKELFYSFFLKFDFNNKDSVLYYVDDLQSEGIDKKDESAIALSNYGIAPYLQSNSLFEEAEERLKKAEKFYLKSENDTMLADLYNCYGNSAYLQGNFSEAELFYNQSAEYAVASGDKRFELLSTFNLSRIYMNQGDYKKAKTMIQEYIDFMLKDGAMRKLAAGYGLMGQLYLDQEKHKEAIDYFTRSMESGLTAGSMQSVANGYTNLAIAEFFSGDKEKSEQYFQLALAYRAKEGDKYYLAEGYFNLGDFYFGTEKYDSALVNYHHSLDVAKASHNLKGQKDALQQLDKIHDTLNQYQQQVEVLKELVAVQEELSKQQSYKEINALKLNFDQTRRENVVIGGIREDELQGKVAEYQSVFNSWMWVTIVCFVILMVFIILFKRLSKSKK